MAKLKRLSISVFILFLFLAGHAIPASAQSAVVMDGGKIVNSRALLPLRDIFEELGAQVQWDAKARQVSATKGNTNIVLKIGSNQPTVNGKKVTIDVPAMIIDSKTFVPLRFVSEALGATVQWDSANYMATVSTPETYIEVYFTVPLTFNEQAAVDLVHAYYEYDPSLSYTIENLYGDIAFLVEVRADFGSGLLTLVDSFVIGTTSDYNQLFISSQLSESDPNEFWQIVEWIRQGQFS